MASASDFANCAILSRLAPEDLAETCPGARLLSFSHRDFIYRQGDPDQYVWCLLEGQIILSRLEADGSVVATGILAAGEFFGHAFGGANEAEDSAAAKGDVIVWRAPVRQFQALLLEHPSTAVEFAAALGGRLRRLERRLEAFAFKRVEARLAQTIRELSGGFATRCEHGFGEHLHLTQQELADLVGASRSVVSTILNRLRDQGILDYSREYLCVRKFEEVALLIES
jgi:CRP-like cAMP-binding protein